MKSPVPIADCHGHIGVHPDFPSYKVEPAEMVQTMELLNIEILAVTSTRACYTDCPRGNAEVSEVLKRYPKQFRGYVTVNPQPQGEALRELEHWAHFHRPPLIKLHPYLHRYPVNGGGYRPVWDYANQTEAVVLVHTWDSDPACSPLLLLTIARDYPRTSIIMGHSGGTWNGYMQALEVGRQTPNTYLDITGSQSHRTILELLVKSVGADRILLGSDMPYLEAAVSLGRVLTAQIPDGAKEAILRNNFMRLLREG
ncbi:MAG: amidohydrolase family protein [Acidobacteria bacterium]|nr:amidohydrolase family protein [Acidobacteriota bacterium]